MHKLILLSIEQCFRKRERERRKRRGNGEKRARMCVCMRGERVHAYASCMPWGNNSYEVSPVNRDVHGTESRMPLRFASFTRF